MKTTLMAALLAVVGAQALAPQGPRPRVPTAGQITVGSILKTPADFQETSCQLQRATDYSAHSGRYIFRSTYDDRALMNIDGRDTELRPVRIDSQSVDATTARMFGGTRATLNLRVGARSTHEYGAGDVDARIEFVVTQVCKPNDESCEMFWVDAKVTVTRGFQKQTIDAKGSCGS